MRNLTMPQAILLGAAIIGAAILITSPAAPARYQFLPETNALWRLDTQAGTGTVCTVAIDPSKIGYLNCAYQIGSGR